VVQNDIRRHYSTALGKLVIPGSSIKGAIRSVIGKYIIQETNNRPRESRDFDAIFGTISNNLMHFLQVSDVEFDRTSSITPFKTFSGDIKNSIRETNYGLEYEGKGMWKFQSGQGERTHDSDFSEDGFVFLYETCSTGTKGKLRLNWAKGLDEITPSNKKPNNYRYYDAVFGNNWMGLAKLQLEKYLEQEIYFFKKFPNENFPNAIELLEEIQAMNNEPDTVMLRLGMGSGYHAITGNWRFHDHTQTGQAERRNRDTRQFEKINAIKYKTRKISFIDNSTEEDSSLWLDLPGFVKIMVQP
jgi:CRISPR/Cas system CSM-associated protein Csm5 (group 7 of RAMP superfamily)